MNESDELRQEQADSAELLEKLNRKIRRRNRWIILTGMVMALLLILAIVFFCMKFFFSVEKIEISGSTVYAEKTMIEKSEIKKGQILFLVFPEKIEKRLLSAFPMLEKAEVHREYPDRIVITVYDETPLFFYDTGNSDAGFAVVSKNQKLLGLCKTREEVEVRFGKLLCVEMPEILYAVVGQKLGYAEKGDSDYIPGLIMQLEKVNLGAEPVFLDAGVRFNIVLQCGQRTGGGEKYRILLGNKDKLEEKLYFAAGIISKLDESFEGIISVEDLKNGYALAFEE